MPKKSHAKKHRPRRSKSEKRTERKLRQKQHQNVYVNVGKGGAPSSGAPIPPIVVSPPDQSQAFSSLFSSLERRLAPIASPYAVSAQLGMESKAPPKMEAPAQTPEVHATIENVPIMGASKADKAIKQTFGTQTDLNIGSPNPTVESIPNRSPDPIQSADFLTGKMSRRPKSNIENIAEEVPPPMVEAEKINKKDELLLEYATLAGYRNISDLPSKVKAYSMKNLKSEIDRMNAERGAVSYGEGELIKKDPFF